MLLRRVVYHRLFNVGLLAVSLIAGAGFISSYEAPPPPGVVVLPVEVIGPDGYVVAVRVNVDNASGVDRLWMQLHNVSDEGEASVRINGGSWKALNNRTVTCAYPESELECVGGAYKTIRGSVAVSGIVSGANTIEFRRSYTPGSRSSGFRVLRLNLLRGSGAEVLPDNAFRYDNPDSWTPPRGDASSIAAGQRLWERENVLTDGPGSGVILRASCADCHAQGGQDLKYFNYSNRSIIERSRFHGLSRADGEKIASFIRSLDTPNPGTPWDPPYQPGPGLDSQPAAEWAAGAGLDAVLDRDEEMLPYLFPNGISSNAVSTTRTLNVREMPVAIQFPDWNEWLPRVHPKDAWGNVFTNHAVYNHYERGFPNVLSRGVPQAVASGAIVDEMEDWAKSFRDFKKDTGKQNYFGGYDADGEVADYMLGLFQWQAVKTWEIMTTNPGLETAAPQIYPGTGEPRSWFGRARAVFDTAPHINGPDQAGPHPQGSELQNRFFSTAWYQVQMTLNSGNRRGLNIRPHDWKYHLEHIRGLGKSTGIREPLRFYQSYIKMMQQADNAVGVGSPSGWHMRHVTPAWLLADRPGNEKDIFQDMDPSLRIEITEALLGAFMDKMDRHALSEWPREMGLEGIEPASYRPQPWPGNGIVFDQTTYADHFYRFLPRFNDLGVDGRVLRRVAEWSEDAWPLGNWDSRYDAPTGGGDDDGGTGTDGTDGSGVGVVLRSPVAGGVYPGVVPVVVEFGPEGTPLQVVKLLVDGELITKRRNKQTPFELTTPALTPGAHTIQVVVKDATGRLYEGATVPITIGTDGGGDEDDGSGGGGEEDGVVLRSPVAGGVYPGVVPVVVEFGPNGTPLQVVKLLVDGALASKVRSPQTPVTLATPELSAGQHTVKVVVRDAAGVTHQSAPVRITVEAEQTVTESIRLTRGWNTVTLSVQPADAAIEEVTASIANVLKKVFDDAGREYNPSLSIREFTTWDAARTYEVKVSAATTLTVEGTPLARMARPANADDQAAHLRADDLAHVFELGSAAPNPSRAQTQIGYSLAEAGPVTLDVFNVVGQRVLTVVDRVQSAGPHTADVDVSGLAPGVYVYVLESGAKTSMRRLVVVR